MSKTLEYYTPRSEVDRLREFIFTASSELGLRTKFDLYTIYRETESGVVYGLIHTDLLIGPTEIDTVHTLMQDEACKIEKAVKENGTFPISYLYVMTYYRVVTAAGEVVNRMGDAIYPH